MSCNLSKVLKPQLRSIESLRGKTLAVDVMPVLYKYLYTYGAKEIDVLRAPDGSITSHIKGLLSFLKKLITYSITPVLCLDHFHPKIKTQELKRRTETRQKALKRLDLLKQNGVSLNQKQQRVYNTMSTVIGPKQKQLVFEISALLGITTYHMDYIEAQKCCAELKKMGLVDQIYSEDRDLILYGTSFYSKLNFKANTVEYYDYQEILKQFQVSSQEILLAGIAVGTDYSKGIPRVGPKTVFKLIKKNKEGFLRLLKENVNNYNEILRYLNEKISTEPKFFRKNQKQPSEFVKKLQDLNFSPTFVIAIASYFF